MALYSSKQQSTPPLTLPPANHACEQQPTIRLGIAGNVRSARWRDTLADVSSTSTQRTKAPSGRARATATKASRLGVGFPSSSVSQCSPKRPYLQGDCQPKVLSKAQSSASSDFPSPSNETYHARTSSNLPVSRRTMVPAGDEHAAIWGKVPQLSDSPVRFLYTQQGEI